MHANLVGSSRLYALESMSMAASGNIRIRRIASGLLIALGALLILLAPETWLGLVLLALGVAVELIGMVLVHQLSNRRPQ